jgi:ATP-dependent RNA circularization protein (DNA/RNA ligase family)
MIENHEDLRDIKSNLVEDIIAYYNKIIELKPQLDIIEFYENVLKDIINVASEINSEELNNVFEKYNISEAFCTSCLSITEKLDEIENVLESIDINDTEDVVNKIFDNHNNYNLYGNDSLYSTESFEEEDTI